MSHPFKQSRNVIKQAQQSDEGQGRALSPLRGVIKRAVVEARAEARRIVAEAESEAASLREQAAEEARELRETAYREGQEAALLELHQLLVEAHERYDTALADAERDLLRLSIKLAEKIIGHELRSEPSTLADIVSTALRQARQHETLTVRVCPAELAHIQSQRERLDPTGRTRFLDLVPDPRVGRGGCIIEGESGTVDAQLDTQLRVLERALLARAAGDGG